VSITLDEVEVVESAARRWWLFLVTGIAWLVFALIVFQWDYTTIYAVSILFGCAAIFAGLNEFFAITVSTTGWKVFHAILGVLFVIAGIWSFAHPHQAFTTIAALIGYFFLFKGIFDVTVAFAAKSAFDIWWLQLIAGIVEILLGFWVAGSFQRSVALLVVYVGFIGLTRGITEIILAFKLRSAGRDLRAGGGRLAPA
jgi:uncharacterized membrane protein HdeD (DUF308 family)